MEKHWKVLYSTLRAPIIHWMSLVLNARPLKSAVLYAQRTNMSLNFIGFEPSTLQKRCTYHEILTLWAYSTTLLEGSRLETNEIQLNIDSLSVQYIP